MTDDERKRYDDDIEFRNAVCEHGSQRRKCNICELFCEQHDNASLRARIALLEKVAEEVADQCPYCQGQGFTVTTGTGMEHDPNDPDGEPIAVPIPIQEQCQFCFNCRAALDALKEG